MRKLLFLDHKYHEITKSSSFFIEILRREFEVDQYYVDPDIGVDDSLVLRLADYELVVVWQMDYLASAICALGKRVVVVPMYDGSGSMPDMHWALLREATFINFSLAMHERTRLMGCKSYLVKYFLPPCAAEDRASFDKINVFFWQRRPDHGINIQFVDRLLGESCDRIHLHDAPDVDVGHSNKIARPVSYDLTTSTWFPSKKHYEDTLRECNVFVCPRSAEGIGVAMLEAMAKGMLVIANDQPTNNEYISNWVNGILFNIHSENGGIDIRDAAARLGYSAWKTVEYGHRIWDRQATDLLRVIETAAPSTKLDVDVAEYLSSVSMSFSAGQENYVNFIQRRAHKLLSNGNRSLDDIAMLIGGRPESHADEAISFIGPDRILNVSDENCPFLREGWSSYENGEYRWIEGRYAVLKFGDARTETIECLSFDAKSIDLSVGDQFLTIDFNRRTILRVALPQGSFTNFSIRLPRDTIRTSNIIELKLHASAIPPGDNRQLSACLSDLRFSPFDQVQ
ncbi:glycosyltransferase [Methylobacterium mesophilicum]|uniref:glycosyltransferase n=1 Tax=Methylobacterium mesophilicum TaxID=39956 RepID=UPI002F347C82